MIVKDNAPYIDKAKHAELYALACEILGVVPDSDTRITIGANSAVVNDGRDLMAQVVVDPAKAYEARQRVIEARRELQLVVNEGATV